MILVRERDFREADFGLDDPGVTVITADKGGSIPSYERKFFGAGTENTRWVVDGYCNSACTMVLGTGRVCATPRARFNFHAGYYKYFGYWNVITPQWTYQMYQHYPDDVKSLGRCASCNGPDQADHDAATGSGDLRAQLPRARSGRRRGAARNP